MSLIELTDVSKAFRARPVLSSVNVQIERGRSYGLVGTNGSGKSVLLQLMCGLITPDAGTVSIDEDLLPPDRSFPDRFGISINGPAYLAHCSALENLLDLASIRGRAGRADCEEILSLVGFDPRSRQRVRSFSLGMKQKLSLAQALMEEPDVLLLDEPFNALDAASVERVTDILRERTSAGVTVVMTSHHRAEIDAVCDSVIAIDNGNVTIEV